MGWGHEGGDPVMAAASLCEETRRASFLLQRRKGQVSAGCQEPVHKPGASRETKSASTPSLGVQPPELWETSAGCLSHAGRGILLCSQDD